MSNTAARYLQRAQALAERHAADERALKELDLVNVAAKDEPESHWSVLQPENPAATERKKLSEALDRTSTKLRMAVEGLFTCYCDEIRSSEVYQTARMQAGVKVNDARSVYGTERKLLGLAREIRRAIASLLALIKDPQRMVNDIVKGVDDELEIFERWRQLRYKTTRLIRLCAETPLPQIAPLIPNGVFLVEEEDQGGDLSVLADAFWELGPRMIPRTGEIALTMVSLSGGLNQWIKLIEAQIADEATEAAEAQAQKLEEVVVAGAYARLPVNLRPWIVLPI